MKFEEIKIGDLVRIAIFDCGSGTATVLSKDETSITINMDRDSFSPCYECQYLVNPLMNVREDEIFEIKVIDD
jgi:hypothetical protein